MNLVVKKTKYTEVIWYFKYKGSFVLVTVKIWKYSDEFLGVTRNKEQGTGETMREKILTFCTRPWLTPFLLYYCFERKKMRISKRFRTLFSFSWCFLKRRFHNLKWPSFKTGYYLIHCCTLLTFIWSIMWRLLSLFYSVKNILLEIIWNYVYSPFKISTIALWLIYEYLNVDLRQIYVTCLKYFNNIPEILYLVLYRNM